MTRHIKNHLCGLICLVSVQGVWAQRAADSLFVLPDSVTVFTIENMYALILKNHPVVRQVELMTETARQEIRLARGNFDPKLEASLLEKNFGGTEYYRIANAELKVPTRFPLDPKAGIDRNSGAYLNPERYVAENYGYQQFYAGFSLPLGRGLFTDDRRTILKQAELFTQTTEAEQIKIINKFLLEAAKEYWEWYYAYYNFRLYESSVRVARDIFDRVKVNVEFGELAPIDSVQAKLTWQERLIEQQEAWLNFTNSGIRLSNFLWDIQTRPLVLDPSWAPALQESSPLDKTTLSQLLETSRENHPELVKIRVKLLHQELDRKLAVENLKPRLDLNYNILNQPLTPGGEWMMPTGKDYKFGLDFSFPILLRKERAKVAMAKLKISDTRYEEAILAQRIQNDIQATYNELLNSQILLEQQRQRAENYNRLLEAEYLNLENGESDLFKFNVQQEKFLDSRSKVLKLQASVEKQKSFLLWAAGVRRLGLDQ